MAKKKKPNIHKVNPVIIREINEIEDIVIKNHYIPVIEDNSSKSEPNTEPMEIECLSTDEIISNESKFEIEIPVEIDKIELETINIKLEDITIVKPNTEPIYHNHLEFTYDNTDKIIESLPMKEIKPKKEVIKKESKLKSQKIKNNITEKPPFEEETTTEFIQDHDINIYNIEVDFLLDDLNVVINPNIDLSIVHRFIEISKNPFELRYKTTKIYDSRISKCDISFNESHVAVDGKKYPYSNLRIINK